MFIKSKSFVSLLFLGLAISAPTAASSKIIVKKSTKFYSISGNNGPAIAKQLITKGPRRTKLSHAIASTQWGYDFGKPKVAVRGRKCVIESIDITVTIKYTLPKWRAGKGASSELKNNWAAFNKLIIAHENKHGEIAEKGAKTLEKTIKSLRGSVSKQCNDFGRFAKLKFTRVAKSISRKQVAFDRRERFALSKIARAQKALLRTR